MHKRILAAAVMFGAAGAVQAQTSFVPVSQTSVPEPAFAPVPLNAGQVILGLATRYVVNVGSSATARIAVSTDGVTITELPLPPGAISALAVGVSDDGSVILGRVGTSSPAAGVAVGVWDAAGAPTILSLGAGVIQPGGISRDGQVIAYKRGSSVYAMRSYVRRGTSVQQIQPDPEDLGCVVFCMSRNGECFAGMWNFGITFTWNSNAGGTLLNTPFNSFVPSFVSSAGHTLLSGETVWYYRARRSNAMFPAFLSDDGTIALGSFGNNGLSAVMWTPTLGTVNLQTELLARGIDLQGWILTNADYLSDDSRTIVGRGTPPGTNETHWWIAHIDPISPADLGKQGGRSGSDGKLDSNDLIVYISRFFAADERADVGSQGGLAQPDGLFDNNDFVAFINQFFASP
jgi:uncharacterized membrane protein